MSETGTQFILLNRHLKHYV